MLVLPSTIHKSTKNRSYILHTINLKYKAPPVITKEVVVGGSDTVIGDAIDMTLR